MVELAIIALIALLWLFVTAMFNTAIDPSSTPKTNIKEYIKTTINRAGTITQQTATKKVRLVETRPLTDTEKRRRFMYIAIAAMPSIVFLVVFLIREASE